MTSSCEICSGPHDTQYCMENPEQDFVDYASSRIDEGEVSGTLANLSKTILVTPTIHHGKVTQTLGGDNPKVPKQSEMANKIDTVLKAITDQIAGALPSDMVKNPKLNVNSTSLVLSTRSYPTIDPQCSSHPSTSINVVKKCSKEANISQMSQLQTGTKIGTQQPEEPKPTLEVEF
ncbi:hypothetical protein Tco_1119034 [Tanacetum coccineum]